MTSGQRNERFGMFVDFTVTVEGLIQLYWPARTSSPLVSSPFFHFLSLQRRCCVYNRVNFFLLLLHPPPYIYRVHDRDARAPKPKKHWLHFLHRRLVDPYASRRWPGYTYTYISWYWISGIMAVPRHAVDSFLPNFTHRYTTTHRPVAPPPPAPQHRVSSQTPFKIVSALCFSLWRILCCSSSALDSFPSFFFILR